MICVIRVIDGPAHGSQVFLCGKQRLLVGRLSTADFSIPEDHHLSRSHLVIEGTDVDFEVIDMGSSNGTFLNNCPVDRAQLSSGDIIRAGKSVFEVQFKTNSPANDPPLQINHQIPHRVLNSSNIDDITNRYVASPIKKTLPLEPDSSSPHSDFKSDHS